MEFKLAEKSIDDILASNDALLAHEGLYFLTNLLFAALLNCDWLLADIIVEDTQKLNIRADDVILIFFDKYSILAEAIFRVLTVHYETGGSTISPCIEIIRSFDKIVEMPDKCKSAL